MGIPVSSVLGSDLAFCLSVIEAAKALILKNHTGAVSGFIPGGFSTLAALRTLLSGAAAAAAGEVLNEKMNGNGCLNAMKIGFNALGGVFGGGGSLAMNLMGAGAKQAMIAAAIIGGVPQVGIAAAENLAGGTL